jgi:hypothetical protein
MTTNRKYRKMMRKMIFTLVCLLSMSVAANAASKTDVVLQHGSKITIYDAENFQSAIEAAVDGDVVFLPEGTYPAFGITKKITVQGVWDATVIQGNVNVDISGEGEFTAPLLQYLKVTGNMSVNVPDGSVFTAPMLQYVEIGNVFVNSETRGLGFKQSKISSIAYNKKTYDAYIDRCTVNWLYIDQTYTETITIDGATSSYTYPKVKKLTVNNSIVGVEGNSYSTNATFINCKIGVGPTTNTIGTVINSIVGHANQGSILNNTEFVNTFISQERGYIKLSSNCTTTGCYFGEVSLNYDSEDIATNGYYGTDGTIIGPLGGTTPFTLTPDLPKVKVGDIKVDTQKQELNVTLTTSQE